MNETKKKKVRKYEGLKETKMGKKTEWKVKEEKLGKKKEDIHRKPQPYWWSYTNMPRVHNYGLQLWSVN